METKGAAICEPAESVVPTPQFVSFTSSQPPSFSANSPATNNWNLDKLDLRPSNLGAKEQTLVRDITPRLPGGVEDMQVKDSRKESSAQHEEPWINRMLTFFVRPRPRHSKVVHTEDSSLERLVKILSVFLGEQAGAHAMLNEKYGQGDPFWNSKGRYINPKSNFMTYWDLHSMLLLIYTSIVTPFEVGFLTTSINTMFFLNRYVDLFFIVDMAFNFLLPYTEDSKGARMETRHAKIRKHYLNGWFKIDLISIIPFDLLALFQDNDAVSNLKALRALKVMRIAKLSRVVRGMRVFKRWESRMSINYAGMNLALLIVGLIMAVHWAACGWAMTLNVEGASWDESFPWLEADDDQQMPLKKYVSCLFWTVSMAAGHLSEQFHNILFTCSEYMQSSVAAKMHSDELRKIPFFTSASNELGATKG
eukprot:gene8719-10340_t